jgi:hypothetical protein
MHTYILLTLTCIPQYRIIAIWQPYTWKCNWIVNSIYLRKRWHEIKKTTPRFISSRLFWDLCPFFRRKSGTDGHTDNPPIKTDAECKKQHSRCSYDIAVHICDSMNTDVLMSSLWAQSGFPGCSSISGPATRSRSRSRSRSRCIYFSNNEKGERPIRCEALSFGYYMAGILNVLYIRNLVLVLCMRFAE